MVIRIFLFQGLASTGCAKGRSQWLKWGITRNMAHIVPVDATRDLELNGGHEGELQTLLKLQADLSDQYWVFHSVHWSRGNGRYTDFGEIDFVIINSSGKVMFVEQKNGPMVELPGALVKEYRSGAKKDVAQQIFRSMGLVHKKFKQHANGLSLDPDYLICLPEYRVVNISSVGIEGSNIVDSPKYDSIAKHIEKIIPVGKADEARFNVLMEFFSDVYDLIPDIHSQIDVQRSHFLRRAGYLTEVLNNLEMNPYRLKVSAIAGSGKSLFATSFYQKQIKANNRPALVCFNRSLAERLKARLSPGGYINTFHGLCSDFLESIGEKPDFSQSSEPGFWAGVLEQVTAADIPKDWQFDSLIIDEGQDFEEEWFEILKLFLKEDGGILWLQDPLQNIYEKTRFELDGFVHYHCNKNYRTPSSLAEYIRDTLDVEFETENELNGLGVEVHEVEKPEAQIDTVFAILKDLMAAGFSSEDIAIISCKGAQKSVFSGFDKIGKYALKKYTGDYDMHGNQQYTSGEIIFDSIYRFKGNQSAAVILVDVDSLEPKTDRETALLFCGMTRATVRLDIVV